MGHFVCVCVSLSAHTEIATVNETIVSFMPLLRADLVAFLFVPARSTTTLIECAYMIM